MAFKVKNKELRNCITNIGLAKKNGKISEVQIILKDITEQIKAEDSIKRSEEKYRNLFETSPVGIVTLNRAGIVTSCNKRVQKISGYSPEETKCREDKKSGGPPSLLSTPIGGFSAEDEIRQSHRKARSSNLPASRVLLVS